jgi:hypothetical protein
VRTVQSLRFTSTSVSIALVVTLAACEPLAAQRNEATGPEYLTPRVSSSYGNLPISFEINQGQADPSAQFLARGAGYALYLRSNDALLALRSRHSGPSKQRGSTFPLRGPELTDKDSGASSFAHLQLINSNPSVRGEGLDRLPGLSNYFAGADPSKWHTGVATYARVRFAAVYPGVDLVYYGNQEGRLEHDFIVAPGADPGRIQFDLSSSGGAPVSRGGELVLDPAGGNIRLRTPVAYQVVGGKHINVPVSYVMDRSSLVRFRLGTYDQSRELVIDPVLVYASVFRGSSPNQPAAMAIDSGRNVYM